MPNADTLHVDVLVDSCRMQHWSLGHLARHVLVSWVVMVNEVTLSAVNTKPATVVLKKQLLQPAGVDEGLDAGLGEGLGAVIGVEGTGTG